MFFTCRKLVLWRPWPEVNIFHLSEAGFVKTLSWSQCFSLVGSWSCKDPVLESISFTCRKLILERPCPGVNFFHLLEAGLVKTLFWSQYLSFVGSWSCTDPVLESIFFTCRKLILERPCLGSYLCSLWIVLGIMLHPPVAVQSNKHCISLAWLLFFTMILVHDSLSQGVEFKLGVWNTFHRLTWSAAFFFHL